MKKIILLLLLTLGVVVEGSAQPIHKGDVMLHGFASKVDGNDFSYYYPIPGIAKNLIVRPNSGQSAAWLTEAVPSDLRAGRMVNFVWPVAIGSNGQPIDMSLSVDGRKLVDFDTRDREQWSVAGADGSSLSFKNIEYDKNRDLKGLMYLRLPSSMVTPGKAVEIKIATAKSDVSTWFITYQGSLTPSMDARLLPAVVRTTEGAMQQLFVNIMHFAPDRQAVIKLDGKVIGKQLVKLGYNTLSVSVPKVEKEREAMLTVTTAEGTQQQAVTLKPSRDWRVNFVQHSHTDIGYTRSQTEILGEHIRYIDYALDYCDLTDSYPEDAKFRWTCEAAWAVEEYLKTRPAEQIERLKKRIKEGRIELTGMLFNFDEMPDEQTLAASLIPLRTFRREGLPVEIAMQNDVNGIGWCFADYFPDLGVKYLNMGTHGHRALICFDYPTLFRWESPSGKQMLAYRAEHYNMGNFLGVEAGNFEQFEIKLLEYLSDLERKGYPMDIAAAQYSGYFTDNSPPSIAGSDMIRKWNEKYESPKLRSAVSTEFFKEAETRYADQIQTIRGAWPDWWTDGFGAGAREVAVSRNTHTDLIAARTVLAMAKLKGARMPEDISRDIDMANRALLFYDEHTTGYSESVRDPYSRQSIDQRALKESYAWEAFRRTRIASEVAQGQLQSYVSKADVPSIVVYNPMNWNRSGMIEAYIDHEILPRGRKFEITTTDGRPVAAQPRDSRSDGTYWNLWVEDVPALGSSQLLIKVSDQKLDAPMPERTLPAGGVVENQWYSMEIDPARGTIKRLFDKELSTDIIDPKAEWQMGEFIYEQLEDRSSMEAYRAAKGTRIAPETLAFAECRRGEIYDAYIFTGNTIAGIELPKRPNLRVEFRLYHTTKQIELAYSLFKKPVITPEGIYVSLPFELADSKIFCEVQGGVMQAGVDQIKGSSNDWNTMQNFVAVRNPKAQIVVTSNEVPLMQFGAINTGRYKAGAEPESSKIYSWPMNNYWVTNFNADQRGEFQWSYLITSMDTPSNGAATRFGWGRRVPLLNRILPAAATQVGTPQPFGSLLELGADNLLLVGAVPVDGENAILMQLREVEGQPSVLNFKSSAINTPRLMVCDALGAEIVGGGTSFKPFETKFVKLSW